MAHGINNYMTILYISRWNVNPGCEGERFSVGPVLRADHADVIGPCGAIADPFSEDVESDAPDLIRGWGHAGRVIRIGDEHLEKEAVVGISRDDDGSMDASREGRVAGLEIEAGIPGGVLVVVALHAFDFEEQLEVALEVHVLWNTCRVEGIEGIGGRCRGAGIRAVAEEQDGGGKASQYKYRCGNGAGSDHGISAESAVLCLRLQHARALTVGFASFGERVASFARGALGERREPSKPFRHA